MQKQQSLPPVDHAAWALFLDIDGTLLDLAARPESVIIPPDLPELLDDLTGKFGGALALVSGRSLDDIDRLFPGGRDAVGSHGAEWRTHGRRHSPHPPWPQALTAGIETAVSLLPGVSLERKSLSLALHFRTAPEQETAVRAIAHATIAEASAAGIFPSLALMEGKAIIEIIPAGIGKGAAIERLMASPPYRGRRPVFAGDDVTDESGFAAVNRMSGLSIHIGHDRVTKAHFRFPDPQAMRQWLAGLNGALAGGKNHEKP